VQLFVVLFSLPSSLFSSLHVCVCVCLCVVCVCVCMCVCVCKLCMPRVCLCLTSTGAQEGVRCFCAGRRRARDLSLSKSVSQRTEIGFMLCCNNAAFQLVSQQGASSGWLHPHIFKRTCRRKSLPLGRRSSQPFLSGSMQRRATNRSRGRTSPTERNHSACVAVGANLFFQPQQNKLGPLRAW
jgi:hypothetical protein